MTRESCQMDSLYNSFAIVTPLLIKQKTWILAVVLLFICKEILRQAACHQFMIFVPVPNCQTFANPLLRGWQKFDNSLKGKISTEKNVFFLPMPEFFGPFSISAFLVNKKSLSLQKCQCIELSTVFQVAYIQYIIQEIQYFQF